VFYSVKSVRFANCGMIVVLIHQLAFFENGSHRTVHCNKNSKNAHLVVGSTSTCFKEHM